MRLFKKKYFFNKYSLVAVFVVAVFSFFTFFYTPSYNAKYSINNIVYPAEYTLYYNTNSFFGNSLELKFDYGNKGIKLFKDKNSVNKIVYKAGYRNTSILYKNKVLETKEFFVSTFGWKVIKDMGSNRYWVKTPLIKDGFLLNYPMPKGERAGGYILFYEKLDVNDKDLDFSVNFKTKHEDDGKIHKTVIGVEFENGWLDFGFPDEMQRDKAHALIGEKEYVGLYFDFKGFEICSDSLYNIKIIADADSVFIFKNSNRIAVFEIESDLGRFEGFNFHSEDSLFIQSVNLSSSGDEVFKSSF